MAAQHLPSPMSFDSATVETILSAMHDGVALATVQLRLRYLQRFDFPPGAKAGRGKRAVYALADILKVALAFELLDLDVNPQRATTTIEHSWPTLQQCLAPAWLAVRLVQDKGGDAATERLDGLRRMIIVEPAALSGDEAGHTVGVLRPSALGEAITTPGKGFRNCMLIDLFAVVHVLDAALRSKAVGMRRSEIDAAFERLGEAAHGGKPIAEWSPPQGD